MFLRAAKHSLVFFKTEVEGFRYLSYAFLVLYTFLIVGIMIIVWNQILVELMHTI